MSSQVANTQSKKKRTTKRHFGRYIAKLQEGIVANLSNKTVSGMSSSAKANLNSLVETMIDKVAENASSLLLTHNKEIVKERIVRSAVMLAFQKAYNTDLFDAADKSGQAAVARFAEWKETNKSGGTKATLTDKAGLLISPVRVDKRLRRALNHKNPKKANKTAGKTKGGRSGGTPVSAEAAVYLAGVIEYILGEMIQDASYVSIAATPKRKRLIPWHLVQIPTYDVEMASMLSGILLSGGAVYAEETEDEKATKKATKKKKRVTKKKTATKA